MIRELWNKLFGDDVSYQDARCAGGKHQPPVWTAEVDHDKRTRKVYGWRSYTICPHCKAEVPEPAHKMERPK